jgi:hypothetical protein
MVSAPSATHAPQTHITFTVAKVSQYMQSTGAKRDINPVTILILQRGDQCIPTGFVVKPHAAEVAKVPRKMPPGHKFAYGRLCRNRDSAMAQRPGPVGTDDDARGRSLRADKREFAWRGSIRKETFACA